jgi:hypothetical protein
MRLLSASFSRPNNFKLGSLKKFKPASSSLEKYRNQKFLPTTLWTSSHQQTSLKFSY